jgi:hypothetical protein
MQGGAKQDQGLKMKAEKKKGPPPKAAGAGAHDDAPLTARGADKDAKQAAKPTGPGVVVVSADAALDAAMEFWAAERAAAPRAAAGPGGPGRTSTLSSSAASTSIRLIFGRIDCSQRVLEARRKCSCQNIRLRAH